MKNLRILDFFTHNVFLPPPIHFYFIVTLLAANYNYIKNIITKSANVTTMFCRYINKRES